jgi:hypothetical protein
MKLFVRNASFIISVLLLFIIVPVFKSGGLLPSISPYLIYIGAILAFISAVLTVQGDV